MQLLCGVIFISCWQTNDKPDEPKIYIRKRDGEGGRVEGRARLLVKNKRGADLRIKKRIK